jgi:chemotaxis protein CheZ
MSTPAVDVHQQIGALTRQLHDSLNGLGLTEKVKDWAGELPDAKSRLSYIARLTGEAAEKVLNQVDQAKVHQAHIATQVHQVGELLAKDAPSAIARGDIAKHLSEMEQSGRKLDEHLTEIMMAQDFHDLTGQVIAKVVNLAASMEEQLIQLLIQTAPPDAVTNAPAPHAEYVPALDGPVVEPAGNPDVVTDQSQVDDLLASLGF